MKQTWRIWTTVLALFFVSLFLFKPSPNEAASPNPQRAFFVSDPVTPKLSRPVSELAGESIIPNLNREINPRHNPLMFEKDMGKRGTWDRQNVPRDPLIGQSINGGQTPTTTLNFEGVGNLANLSPPDVVGDVGPNHYVQMVNVQFAIYNKAGNQLVAPTAINALFSGAGGVCEAQNEGDPIPVYDPIANRWLLSQFAYPSHICIAISTSPDPTQDYYLYEFDLGDFPDYFKFGVWPDGYYMSANEDTYTAYAFDRVKMVAGQGATFQKFTGEANFLLPSDLDGAILPPTGTPNYFYTFKDNSFHGVATDRIEVFAFDVDWVTPGNSTFDLVDSLDVAPFTYTACGFFNFLCIGQPDTTQRFDSLGEWPMFSFRYRNFDTHETLVGTYNVGGGTGDAGASVRWFELRKTGADWTLYQEGTQDLNDGHDRFNASIAMDSQGNIALGFSVSSPTRYPSIHYTTRLASDPLGTMQAEAVMMAGSGSQTNSARWGDYSTLSIDPADDCTFWYTNEYYAVTSGEGWQTRIGTFQLPGCTSSDFSVSVEPETIQICTPNPAIYTVNIGQTSSVTTSVSLSAMGHPAGTTAIFGANPVTSPATTTLTIGNTGSAATGMYNLMIMGTGPTSTHTSTVTLDVFTVAPSTPTLNLPADGATNVSLNPTFNWLTATQTSNYLLEIASDPGFATIVYSATITDTTHQAIADFNTNTTYYWRVTAANICGSGTSSSTFSFTTPAATLTCNQEVVDFETGIPTDWTVVDNSTGEGIVWGTTADITCGQDNLTNGSGEAACADSDIVGGGAPAYDTALVSPAFDLSGVTTATLAVAAYYNDYDTGDFFNVDVWNGTSWDTLINWTSDHAPEDIGLDLANYIGQSDAQVRFRYAGNGFDWYAQVDDIALSCSLPTSNIVLTKTVGLDPGGCATTNQIDVAADTSVTYCYTIENTGSITLTTHNLEDSQLGTLLNSEPYPLAPGGTFWLTASTTITQDTINTATWTAYNAGPSDVTVASDTAWVNVLQPEITLAKTASINPASCASQNQLVVSAGSEVVYCYKVTNSGEVTFTTHNLEDDQLGELFNGLVYSLAPGENVWVTETTTITADTVNMATWTAYNPGPSDVVSATAWATVTLGTPTINLTKTVGTDPASCAVANELTVFSGSEVIYCYAVENTGEVTLYWHNLYDDQLDVPNGSILVSQFYTLTTGSTFWLTATAIITQDTVNMATWTAYNPGPIDLVSATAWATVTVVTPTHGVILETEAITLSGAPGETVTYTLWLTNTGNITDSYTLSSSGLWANNTSADVTDLAPDAGTTVQLWVTIPATATNNQMDETTVSATSTSEASATDNLLVTTTAIVEETNNAPVAVDDTATTNAEAAILISVLDNDSDPDGDAITVTLVSDPANGRAVITPTGILYTPDAGFSGTETFAYTITDGDLTDTALVTITVNGLPQLALVKSADSVAGITAVPLDGVVTYTISLSNQGTGDATAVTISDPLPPQVVFGAWVVQNGATLSDTAVLWGPGDIQPNTTEMIVFTVLPASETAQYEQTITNTAWFSSTNAGGGQASATFTTAAAPERGFILYLPLVLK